MYENVVLNHADRMTIEYDGVLIVFDKSSDHLDISFIQSHIPVAKYRATFVMLNEQNQLMLGHSVFDQDLLTICANESNTKRIYDWIPDKLKEVPQERDYI